MPKEKQNTMKTKEKPVYISQEAITAIASMEDVGDDPNGLPTALYGITEDNLATTKKSSLVTLSQRLKTIKFSDITENDARELAYANAERNSKILESRVLEYDKDASRSFMSLPLDVRSAILTQMHKYGERNERYLEQYKIACSDKDTPERRIARKSNIIWNAIHGSKQDIISAILTDRSTGELREGYRSNPKKGDLHNGLLNRDLMIIYLLNDPTAKRLSSSSEKDNMLQEWKAKCEKEGIDVVKASNQKNQAIKKANNLVLEKQKQNVGRLLAEANDKYFLEKRPGKQAVEESNNIADNPADNSLFQKAFNAGKEVASNLLNSAKNLFTNKEEQQNGTERNENVNMQ